MLYTLFSKYFDMCLLPSVLLKAVINPIPKGANKDPLVPLNYRGISLLSCVGIVFSGIRIIVLLTIVKGMVSMERNKMGLEEKDLVKTTFLL